VRACVNFWHLEAVTNAENNLRGESVSAQNARKTHCAQGHAYGGENLKLKSVGQRVHRVCITCRRQYQSQYKKRKRHYKELLQNVGKS
jgi:hypothetical protein